MNLIIQNPNQDKLEEFISTFVMPEIYFQFMKNIDLRHLRLWEEYFQNSHTWDLGDIPQGAFDILFQGIKSLKIIRAYNDSYIITIDSNKIMPKTHAKLYDLCALINYGNLSMNAYPIFEKTFINVVESLPHLFKEYREYLRNS